MIVIDKLFKKKYIEFDFMKIQTMIQTFFEWIWKNENYSQNVIFDKNTQFIAHFWQRLCDKINIKFKLFTTWHSKTNEQTKNVNVNFKTYLRVFVNYKQNDWFDWFFIVEFENNSNKNVFIKIKFFFATKKYLSRFDVEFFKFITHKNFETRREMRNANKWFDERKKVRIYLREKFKWIQIKQIKFVDARRHSISKFKINDMIMLNVKYQIINRSNKKFDYKNFDSYFIVKTIDNCAYELKFSNVMKNVFSIFHFWLLYFDENVSLSNQKKKNVIIKYIEFKKKCVLFR